MEKNQFLQRLKDIMVEINGMQYEQFIRYYELLTEWNQFMNLTGITDYDEVMVKHFVDSLAVRKAIVEISHQENQQSGNQQNLESRLDFSKEITIIDVGTGAGFPGLPIKIAFPETRVMLLDSLNKRVNFLREVIQQLGLEGIEAVHGRAEEFARRPDFRESYTLGVSRAVANLSTLAEYVLPFVKTGGYFIAYKSGDIEEEVQAAGKAVLLLGGLIRNTYKFILPGTDIERSFVLIEKIKSAPKKYPRKAGLPGKEPIQ